MALITCPECGREISDKAVSCPHCGYPLQTPQAETVRAPGYSVLLVVAGDEAERIKVSEIFELPREVIKEKANRVLSSARPVLLVSGLPKEEAEAKIQQTPFPNHLKLVLDGTPIDDAGNQDFFSQVGAVVLGVIIAILLLSFL